MRNTLLDQLYTAFNRDPDAATVLRISHPDGAAWRVERNRLTVATESGAPLADISLRTGTIDHVAAALSTAGVDVVYLRPDFGPRHASTLIDGAGVESESNGNSMLGHRSVLWGLVSAYTIELEDAGDRAAAALHQARLDTAQGDWLDYWGGYFGVQRSTGLGDADYLTRIIVETLRPRSNKYAIESTVLDYTGKVIDIEEPWEQIFLLDSSKLSSDHKIKDGTTIGRNLIRPTARESLDWSDVLAVIHRNRAAGVLVLPPIMTITSGIDASIHGDVFSGILRSRFGETNYEDRTRLDFNAIEDIPVLNNAVLYRREIRRLTYTDATMVVSIETLHIKTYREYLSRLDYPSHSWVTPVSWGSSPETWGSLIVSIETLYTRT